MNDVHLKSALSMTIAVLNSWHKRPDLVRASDYEELAVDLAKVEEGGSPDWDKWMGAVADGR